MILGTANLRQRKWQVLQEAGDYYRQRCPQPKAAINRQRRSVVVVFHSFEIIADDQHLPYIEPKDEQQLARKTSPVKQTRLSNQTCKLYNSTFDHSNVVPAIEVIG